MRLLRLIPVIIGVVILLFGLYLVSTQGYLGGTYLPGLIGIPACNSDSSSGAPSNGTGCTGFGLYGGYGVGTIVCLFGLGILASSIRRAVYSPGPSGSPMTPEMATALAQAQSRVQAPPSLLAPGPRAGTVYCSKCGAANPAEARFCHQCASVMPGMSSPPGRSAPPGSGP